MRALPLLVVVLATACTSGSPSLSKAAYLKASEAICEQLETAGHALPEPASPKDLPAYLATSTRLTLVAKVKLDQLARDYADGDHVRKIFLEPMAAQLKAVADVLPKVAAESAKGGTATLDALTLPQADLQAMGVYGFHECRKVVGSR